MNARRKMSLETNDGLLAFLLNIPTLIFLFFTILFPIGYSFYISLFNLNYKRIHKTTFIGLGNYFDLLKDQDFLLTIGRTFVFVAWSVILVIVLATLIATLLNQEFKGRGILRTVILIPWAIPPVVNGIMWKYILDSSYGVLNGILFKLGWISQYISFLSDSDSAFAWAVFAGVWKRLPFAILLILAALQTIPKELYESAKIDGASIIRQFISITMPMISGTIMVVLIFQTMIAIRVFDLIYVLTSGGPGDATTVIGWALYTESFRFLNFGRANAIGYIITILTFGMAMIYYRIFKRKIY